MKKEFLVLTLLTFIIIIGNARVANVIGSTDTTPFYPNRRAICRDASNIIHVVWQKDAASFKDIMTLTSCGVVKKIRPAGTGQNHVL
jgi:hypothetical protein